MSYMNSIMPIRQIPKRRASNQFSYELSPTKKCTSHTNVATETSTVIHG